jgi:hypothetical protein
MTAWVWCDNENSDLQAIFGVATANFKYTMTFGWGNERFYYTDGIKVQPPLPSLSFSSYFYPLSSCKSAEPPVRRHCPVVSFVAMLRLTLAKQFICLD